MPPRRVVTSASYKRSSSELQIHIAVVDLIRLSGVRNLIWYHVPNHGARSTGAGAKLKAMGMLPGVADFALVLPPEGTGAFLEIKTEDGRHSLEQLAFQSRCYEAGVPYALARSLDEAKAILAGWGALRKRIS